MGKKKKKAGAFSGKDRHEASTFKLARARDRITTLSEETTLSCDHMPEEAQRAWAMLMLDAQAITRIIRRSYEHERLGASEDDRFPSRVPAGNSECLLFACSLIQVATERAMPKPSIVAIARAEILALPGLGREDIASFVGQPSPIAAEPQAERQATPPRYRQQ